jgi:hypothetical protein
MRKAAKNDEIPAEIDFSGGVRGKHVGRFGPDTTLVLLEPDVCKTFPDAKAVNSALRLLIKAGAQATKSRVSREKAS